MLIKNLVKYISMLLISVPLCLVGVIYWLNINSDIENAIKKTLSYEIPGRG